MADPARLRSAYRWLEALLLRSGLEIPPFPEVSTPLPNPFKPYPCLSLDFESRVALIRSLAAPLEENLRLRHRVVQISSVQDYFRLEVQSPAGLQRFEARRLIAAGGRFFSARLGLCSQRFMRWELGIRLQGPAEHPFFEDLYSAGRSLDPKLIISAGRRQWRSFCYCAQGEVVTSKFEGLQSLSGRSDCPPTGLSNLGFNVRFLDPEPGVSLEPLQGAAPFQLKLSALLQDPELLDPLLGPVVAAALYQGILRLAQHLPRLLEAPDLEVMGPCVEGIGRYAISDGNLQAPGLSLSLAGDCCGRFRGLVAALLSGAYVGLSE